MNTTTDRELRGRRALWRLSEPIPDEMRGGLGTISPMLAHLLYCREYRTVADIDTFFTGGPIAHDAGLLPDMAAAVERIARAVAQHETVAVYGDFDCDGLTATAILEEALTAIGLSPHIHLPNREEGHGLHPESLAALADAGVTLVVTADCGIGSIEEVRVARGLGMDMIVTDHHAPHTDGSLPDCLIVAPTRQDATYPCRFLCGAGVAFKLVEALAVQFPGVLDPAQFMDLVALGTVADIVPLRDENRAFVVRGIAALQRTTRPGLRALFRAAGVESSRIDPVSISFYLAPRINAANRMALPQLAYDLITARDEQAADDLAGQLSRHNEERQRLVEQHVLSLTRDLGDVGTFMERVRTGMQAPILVVQGKWPSGLSGLLATRLVEVYGLPVFAAAETPDGTVSASGRGTPGVHIEELLDRTDTSVLGGLFQGHGGHARAGGFRVAVDRWQEAQTTLEAQARMTVSPGSLGTIMDIDAEIPLTRLTFDAARKVRSLAPFGMGFAEPLFLAREVRVRSVTSMGNGKHARLSVQQGQGTMKAVCFRADSDMLRLSPDTCIDAVFHVQLNEWNGSQTVQLQIRDWRLSQPAQ